MTNPMDVVLIATGSLCLLLLLTACYRWCKLINRDAESRQENTACPTSIAVVGTAPYQPRRSVGNAYSEEAGSGIFYDSAYPHSHQLPPYTIRPPPYEPPPVFPDEPPPSYASVAREERRQHQRIRIASSRTEG
jgi:hypothetical protein